MKSIRYLFITFLLLFSCVACSMGEKNDPPGTTAKPHPSDPGPHSSFYELDYDAVSVTLPKTVYSLAQDIRISAIIDAGFDDDDETASITYFLYPNIDKWENGEWVRYYNPGYDSRDDLGNEPWPLPGWLCWLHPTVSVGVNFADIQPTMTPGHYRMIVYLADSHTYYLEFDLVE